MAQHLQLLKGLEPAGTATLEHTGPSQHSLLSLMQVWATQLTDFPAAERRHLHLVTVGGEPLASGSHTETPLHLILASLKSPECLSPGPFSLLPGLFRLGRAVGVGLRLDRPGLPLPSSPSLAPRSAPGASAS